MIGIIQGRLSPPRDGKIQSFPWKHWEGEFDLARNLGIDAIGWIFEEERWKENPLWTTDGRNQLKEIMDRTGVRIEYVCADYFMENPFIRASQAEYDASCLILKEVMKRSSELGIRGVELPMVDNSRITSEEEARRIVKTLRAFIPLMEELQMALSIESSLPPAQLKDLVEQLNHHLFCLTYDTGNSASLGYDADEEIRIFGEWIGNVHMKDRLFHGTTVALGTGDVNFDKTFAALAKINYQGLFTLQAARAGDAIANTKHQFMFLCQYLDRYLK